MTTFVNSTIVRPYIVNRKLVLPSVDAMGKDITSSYHVYIMVEGAAYVPHYQFAAGTEHDLNSFMLHQGMKPFTVGVECEGSFVTAVVKGVLKEKHGRFTFDAPQVEHGREAFDTQEQAELVGGVLQRLGYKVGVYLEDGSDEVGCWHEWACHFHKEGTASQECPVQYQEYVDTPASVQNEDYNDEDDESYLGESVFARIAREKAAKAALPPCVDPVAQHEKYPED